MGQGDIGEQHNIDELSASIMWVSEMGRNIYIHYLQRILCYMVKMQK